MAVPDPKIGNFFVWLLSCALFGFIIAGCVCLVIFISTNDASYGSLGLVLVGIPWLFWILTFLYRFITRSLGIRGIGSMDNVGGRKAAGSGPADVAVVDEKNAPEGNAQKTAEEDVSSPESHESERPLAVIMPSA